MKRKKQFTLVELLVTMSILAFFLVVLGAFFTSVDALWQESEKRTSSALEAQRIFNIVDRLFAGSIPEDSSAGSGSFKMIFSYGENLKDDPNSNSTAKTIAEIETAVSVNQ